MTDHPETEIARCLSASPATLPPKLFYDVLGSTLFTAICLLPEYYQTRTEAAIFREHGAAIGRLLPTDFRLVDLGAGDCRKAAGLFSALQPRHYTPVDISSEFLQAAAANVAAQFPDLSVQPLVRDFTGVWEMPHTLREQPIVYFYPGSSIGNFDPDEAVEFLSNLRAGAGRACQLIIGIDTIKDAQRLTAAYDDALGVTAAFNRNVLLHVNRLLGADFDVTQWEHRAVYDSHRHRIEMHLVARDDVVVNWSGGGCRFAAGQTIHTESSYKHTPDSFAELLRRAGFSVTRQWQDDAGDFLVLLAATD